MPTSNGAHDYRYPNLSSYNAGREFGSKLRHGIIYSLLQRNSQMSTDPTRSGTFRKDINTNLYKYFQYNPPDLSISLQGGNVNPPGTDTPGGGAEGIIGVGNASASFELFFTRDQETYAGTRNIGRLSNSQGYTLYKRLGVQRDIMDLYRVILGADNELDLPTDSSIFKLTSSFFDFAAQGRSIIQRPVCVTWNDDLTLYGNVDSLGWRFTKFNFDLVPIWANVTISLTILNIANTAQISGSFGTNTVVPGQPFPGLSNSGGSSYSRGP